MWYAFLSRRSLEAAPNDRTWRIWFTPRLMIHSPCCRHHYAVLRRVK